jgi:class 3 adenylate cyclase/glyoxylase-like metal-dependent hydrolase (beta-lactamase superfamily II)
MKHLDDSKAIEVADKIWWVGFADYEAGFSNNPYLMIDGDEAVLFDPGPGHPIFRDMIMGKIRQIIDPEKIKYIIVHHQDPDLCGLIPLIENILHPDVTILCESRTALFIPYYGSRKGIMPICDEDILRLKSGREIKFFHTPYLHFAGNMFSYDIDTASVFTSDIFGCFNQNWTMYSDDSYLEPVKTFIEHYISNREPLQYAYDKLKSLKIDRILPQHGAIIEDNINKFIELLITTEPGRLLRDLQNKPSKTQEKEILEAGKTQLALKLKKKIAGNNLNELMDAVAKEGPVTMSMLIDTVLTKASELGVSNPLTRGRLHKAVNMQVGNGSQLLDSLRKRFLSRQYGIMSDTNSVEKIMQQGLKSFETNVVVMFIDIRGFTKWSSEKAPNTIMNALSIQHDLVAKIINSNGGRVNKIIGDGMLAYFMEDNIAESIEVADKIHRAISENQLLPVGVGMDFGKVIMGDLGEDARLDYTLIGSTVNLASRMCDSATSGETAITMQLHDKLDNKIKVAITSLKSREKLKVKIKPSDPETEAVKFISCELNTEFFQ